MAPSTLSARRVCIARAALQVVCATLALGCDGEVVNLGSSERMLGGGDGGSAGAGNVGGTTPGGAPHVWTLQVDPIVTEEEGLLLANPTLNGAMTELYFTQQVRGAETASTISMAVAAGKGFGSPTKLTLGHNMPDASSPAISDKADELWFSMLGDAKNAHIWHSLRTGDTWSAPTLVDELNMDGSDDAPRPPTVDGTIMPLSSKRHGGVLYQIYLAERPSASDPWGTPSKDLLPDTIDSAAFQSAGGFLADEGRTLYFSSTRDGDSDLYVARRTDVTRVFGDPEPLVDLNDPGGSASDERTPWLSPAGDRLDFASDRSGQYALYVATRVVAP